jgi:lipopolysaccharide heptosyltransferase II
VRILLVRLRPLGDVVFTTPLLSALRRHYPDAHMTYLVEPDAAPIVEGNPHVNEVIAVPRRRGLSRLRDDMAMAGHLTRGRFDLAIDLHGGPRSAWLTWASRAQRRIGYTITGRSWMYTEAIPRSRELTPRHSVLNQWDLVAPMGIPPLDPARDPVQMFHDRQADSRVHTYLAQSGVRPDDALVVIHASASTRFKRWPEESFVELVAALVRQDGSRRVFLTSGPSDAQAAQRIMRAARAQLGVRASAILESQMLELPELHALIARAALFIGGDSGPLHIAATTPVPIVELLGPTLAERSRPWRDPRWFAEVVEPGPLPCRPCHQRTCIPGDFRCLTSIGADRVIAAAERALRPASQRSHITPDANERKIPLAHR